MTCPKCHGEMRMYERSGVTVDQCTECRGIFLDRGEMEKLFEAESSWNSRQGAPGAYAPGAGPGYPPAGRPPGYSPSGPGYPPAGGPGYPPPAYGHHGHYRQQGGTKRRKGFLGELFD